MFQQKQSLVSSIILKVLFVDSLILKFLNKFASVLLVNKEKKLRLHSEATQIASDGKQEPKKP